MATTETNRRQLPRIKAKLRAECKVNGKVHKASTIDIHPKGIAVVTGPRFPDVDHFELSCYLPSGTRTRFKVSTRYRRPFKSKSKSFLRLGLIVLASSKNARSFFETLLESHPPFPETIPHRLPLAIHLVMDDRLVPLNGCGLYKNQLCILSDLAFAKFPKQFRVQVSSGSSAETFLTVEKIDHGHAEVENNPPEPVIRCRIREGEAELTSLLEKLENPSPKLNKSTPLTDQNDEMIRKPDLAVIEAIDLSPASETVGQIDPDGKDPLLLPHGAPVELEEVASGLPDTEINMDHSANLDAMFEALDPSAIGTSPPATLPDPFAGDPSANLEVLEPTPELSGNLAPFDLDQLPTPVADPADELEATIKIDKVTGDIKTVMEKAASFDPEANYLADMPDLENPLPSVDPLLSEPPDSIDNNLPDPFVHLDAPEENTDKPDPFAHLEAPSESSDKADPFADLEGSVESPDKPDPFADLETSAAAAEIPDPFAGMQDDGVSDNLADPFAHLESMETEEPPPKNPIDSISDLPNLELPSLDDAGNDLSPAPALDLPSLDVLQGDVSPALDLPSLEDSNASDPSVESLEATPDDPLSSLPSLEEDSPPKEASLSVPDLPEKDDEFWDFGGKSETDQVVKPSPETSDEPSPETSFWAAEIPELKPLSDEERDEDQNVAEEPMANELSLELESNEIRHEEPAISTVPEKQAKPKRDPGSSTNPEAPPSDTLDKRPSDPPAKKDPGSSTNPEAPPGDSLPPTGNSTHPGSPPSDTFFDSQHNDSIPSALAAPSSSAPDAVDDTVSGISTFSPLLSKTKYRFLKKLGQGGFAEVYLVQDLTLDRPVAMKVLNAKLADKPELSQRFIAEAQIAAKFHHPNIVLVYEVGVFESAQYGETIDFPPEILSQYPKRIAYFTMQYIEGRTLAAINQTDESFSQMQILDILHEAAKALIFAHQKGVVHRDIKPENIMLTYENQVLVTDFGIAKVVLDSKENQETPDIAAAAELTGTQQTVGFLGTPNYVSPEQAEGHTVDGRADIYSLGVTGYELLAGSPPFTSKKWVKVLSMHLYDPPKPLREVNQEIHPNMAQVIHRCLEKKPEDRYQSADEFLRALDSLRYFMQSDPLKIEAMEKVDDEARDQVKELFVRFARTFRTIGQYPSHHEIVRKSTKALHDMFEAYFERFERLDVEVESMAIEFQKIVVFEEDQTESSLCFNLYRDGIRSLTFFRGFSLQEMNQFMNGLYHYVHDRQFREKDSVTLLFQMGLQYLDFEYVDAFYEGHEHNTALKDLEQELRNIPDTDSARIRQDGTSLRQLMPFFDYMDQAAANLDKPTLTEALNRRYDSLARRETVRILFRFITEESDPEAIDDWVNRLDNIIQFSVRAKDLQTPSLILRMFSELPAKRGVDNPEAMRRRWLTFRKQYSHPKFLDVLANLFESVSREFKSDIKSICQRLDPQVGLEHVFKRFVETEEEWRKRFFAEMCVAISLSTPKLLVKLSGDIDDKQTALLVRTFREDIDQLPQSALQPWLTHNGEQTRMALVKELAGVDRPDTKRFVRQAALDTEPKYYMARQAAWMYFAKNEPVAFASVLRHFYDVKAIESLGGGEKKILFQSLRTPSLDQEGLAFLGRLVKDDQANFDDRKRGAVTLKQSGNPEALTLLQQIAKKKLGNRDFTQFLRKIVGDS